LWGDDIFEGKKKMETEQQQQVWPFSAASVVEDMLQENIGTRPRGVDLVASRKAEEACMISIFSFIYFFVAHFD
jgi:hypothetical protein